MKSSLHKLLILCCALYLSGAHWVVMQSAAWTGMVVSRSLDSSLSEAVQTTFDGRHPCPMCSAIADGKQTQEQSEKNVDLLKKAGDWKFTELTFPRVEPRLATAQAAPTPYSPHGTSRTDAPPTPPPLA